ncbi:MAG: cobalt transporter [Cyclobacteriaceae bacterium]|nr:MAG: cobalt transporter [Cyclobacteriaceae bacterium]
MGSSHHNHHHNTANIRVAFLLNLVFTVIEIIGGFLTNSMAILSDALHDLGDSISLGLSWYLEKYSNKARDSHYTHGYARFSLLSALINAVVLISGSLLILIEAIPRILNPVQPDTKGMMLLAILGIIFNGIAVIKLRKGESLNQQMVSWHLWEDVLGWIGVLVISIVMRLYEIPELDGIFSVLFTLFILYNVIKVLKKTLKIFLQRMPENLDIEQLTIDLRAIPSVISSHDLRVWSMDGMQTVMTLHVVVPETISKQQVIKVKSQVQSTAENHGITHVTTEIEYDGENCNLVPV